MFGVLGGLWGSGGAQTRYRQRAHDRCWAPFWEPFFYKKLVVQLRFFEQFYGLLFNDLLVILEAFLRYVLEYF